MIRNQHLSANGQTWFSGKFFIGTALGGPTQALTNLCLDDLAKTWFLLNYKEVVRWLSQKALADALSQRLQSVSHLPRALDALIDQFIKVMRRDRWSA